MFEKARNIQLRRELDGEQGFTLIELLIVIIVLGILAAIVVFALGGVTGQSAVASCNTDAKTISVAVSAYEANNPNWTNAALTGTTGENDLLGTGGVGNTTPYLKSWPSNASYYTVALTSGQVEVTLAANTPGTTWTNGTSNTAVLTTPFTEQYDGSGAFTYPAYVLGSASTQMPSADGGANICAGA